MLVILGAVELPMRREATRTVERMSVDDVLSCGMGTVHHRSGSERLYDPIMQPLFEVTVTQMCTSNSRQKHKYLVMIIKQQLDAN